MTEAGPGEFRTELATTGSGVYRVLVGATGRDGHGRPFTREELRTVSVWARGDDPAPVVIDPRPAPGPGTGLDLCRFLRCLLDLDGVRRSLEERGVRPEEVAACLKRACR